MKLKIFFFFLLAFLFTLSFHAQEAPKNLLEKTNLIFSLNGLPSFQEVGFDNPKNSWKVKYELYLTDFAQLETIGICHRDSSNRHICEINYDKNFDKPIKKKSLKLTKGKFLKKSLSQNANREVLIPVNLPPDIIEIFNQAVNIPERNPTFVLLVSQKISTKTATKAKLKEKRTLRGISQLKTANSNRDFEYWDVSRISSEATVEKLENGKLRLVLSRIR